MPMLKFSEAWLCIGKLVIMCYLLPVAAATTRCPCGFWQSHVCGFGLLQDEVEIHFTHPDTVPDVEDTTGTHWQRCLTCNSWFVHFNVQTVWDPRPGAAWWTTEHVIMLNQWLAAANY